MPFRHYGLLHFTLKRNLSEVYFTIFLKTFAMSLIGLFIPIYLLKEIGISFPDLLIFLIFANVFVLIGYFFGTFIGSHIGIRRLISLSVPFFILHYILLYLLPTMNIPLNLIAIVLGLGRGIFWFAYNIDFAKFSDKKHRGEEVKVWFVLASLLGTIGPFIGGLLLTYFNFYVLFSLVIFIYILSALPLLKSKDVFVRYTLHFRDIFRKENYENAPRYTVQAVRQVVSGIFWPIFVFLLLTEYFSTGIVFAAAAAVSSFAVWFIGNQVDRINRKIFADFTSMIDGIVSFTKIFVSSFPQILSVAVLGGVTHSSSEIAHNALAFDQANKSKIIGFFLFREIILSISRLSFLAIILLAGLDIMSSLKLGFILLGAVGFLQWLF